MKYDGSKDDKNFPAIENESGLEAYLKLNGIDRDDQKQLLSHKQAEDIVSIFWEEKAIKKCSKKVLAAYEKPGHYYFISVGTFHAEAVKEDE